MKCNRPYEPDAGQDFTGWFWTPKVDGFRCVWTGTAFASRQSIEFDAPASWIEQMPKTPLDGELFTGSWSATASSIKRGDWSGLRFHVFDAPINGTLFERLAEIPELPSFCRVLNHQPLFGRAHLESIMADIVDNGGEGIVVRHPDARYFEPWFKLKPIADDECEIVAPIFTTYTTMAGSYHASWRGREIKVHAGPCPSLRAGAVATFRFRGLDTAGNPRQPRIKGVRQFD